MPSKAQRQNQYLSFLVKKKAKLQTRGRSTAGVEKEIAFMTGDKERPPFRTGRDADPRYKKRS